MIALQTLLLVNTPITNYTSIDNCCALTRLELSCAKSKLPARAQPSLRRMTRLALLALHFDAIGMLATLPDDVRLQQLRFEFAWLRRVWKVDSDGLPQFPMVVHRFFFVVHFVRIYQQFYYDR
jgi:hypothetical protein